MMRVFEELPRAQSSSVWDRTEVHFEFILAKAARELCVDFLAR